MKTFACDMCKQVITNPHECKMREFYIGCDIETNGVFPVNASRKRTVHLCDQCYNAIANVQITSNMREVVECKDCRYCLKADQHELWCTGFCQPARLVTPDDYCSHGRRA